MTHKSFEELMSGYVNNQLTEEELAHFLQLIQQEEYASNFKQSVGQLLANNSSSSEADPNKADVIFQKIMDNARKEEAGLDGRVIHLQQRPKRNSFLRIAAAASIIGLLLLGTFFWFNRDEQRGVAQMETRKKGYKNDVLPGGNKALLTLADGSTIVLDDAQNGTLTEQGATKVIKLGGKLAYDPADAGSTEIVYNTISTPRGGQYQIELPDGSQVWLNAASSVRFPTAFAGKERRVEITGEAYFEVAKNKAMPFIVSINGAEVQVLGTHFNVAAYEEEQAVKTTLLEGSVRFVSGNNACILKPGQQSQLTKEGHMRVVSGVDVDEVMAWKNGMFYFESADIETVMRQLARWYDVEVVFKGKDTKEQFIVEMPRSSKLSDVLRVLEVTGNLKFDIEGKKVIVMM
jgi:ferric-dicitrate binding protein FerR (iron transport regulator)